MTQPTQDFHPPVSDCWASSEEIARLEGTKPRWARRKYLKIADSFGDDYALYIRHSTVFGGRRLEFNLAVLDAETGRKYRSQESGVGSRKKSRILNPAGEIPNREPSVAGACLNSPQENLVSACEPA